MARVFLCFTVLFYWCLPTLACDGYRNKTGNEPVADCPVCQSKRTESTGARSFLVWEDAWATVSGYALYSSSAKITPRTRTVWGALWRELLRRSNATDDLDPASVVLVEGINEGKKKTPPNKLENLIIFFSEDIWKSPKSLHAPVHKRDDPEFPKHLWKMTPGIWLKYRITFLDADIVNGNGYSGPAKTPVAEWIGGQEFGKFVLIGSPLPIFPAPEPDDRTAPESSSTRLRSSDIASSKVIQQSEDRVNVASTQQPQFSFSSGNLWGNADWEGDNLRFAAARKEIALLYEEPGQLKKFLVNAREIAIKSPVDALLQYRFAYAAWLSTNLYNETDYLNLLRDALNQLLPLGSQQPYDVLRLAFLINTRLFPDTKMLPLGKKLIEHKPTDTQVEWYYISLLTVSSEIQDNDEAITRIRKQIRNELQNKEHYYRLGFAYICRKKSLEDVEKSKQGIAAFNKYLSLAPPNNPYRKHAKRFVQILEEKLKNAAGTNSVGNAEQR